MPSQLLYAEWTSVLSTKDDETWDEKYGEEGGALSYGSAAQQGPRDSMEDYVAIVPKGRCGYLYAGPPRGCCLAHAASGSRQQRGRPVQGCLMATRALLAPTGWCTTCTMRSRSR